MHAPFHGRLFDILCDCADCRAARLALEQGDLCQKTMLPVAYCGGCRRGEHREERHVQGLRQGPSVGEEVGNDRP